MYLEILMRRIGMFLLGVLLGFYSQGIQFELPQPSFQHSESRILLHKVSHTILLEVTAVLKKRIRHINEEMVGEEERC